MMLFAKPFSSKLLVIFTLSICSIFGSAQQGEDETNPPVPVMGLPSPPSEPPPALDLPITPTVPPTESPAPSPGPSDAPTEPPTESPAPSPSPSEAPTERPTGTSAPTRSPTEEPTESPAPSPSPSEAPTMLPTTTPSEQPSLSPTITPQPTDAPSFAPSFSPSEVPSHAPSLSPTLSFAPTSGPTGSPSEQPSRAPSRAPSYAPTISPQPSETPSVSPTGAPTETHSGAPSEMPSSSPTTSAPSDQPSNEPTMSPSFSPTANPTDLHERTKTSVTNVLLVGIEDKMQGEIVGDFEIATLEFIIASEPPTYGFEIDLVAVTVLKQTHVDLNDDNVVIDAHGARRNLEDGPVKHALQVEFRTVGIVATGHMSGTKFEDITEDGFKKDFDGYLFALSQKHEFFSFLRPEGIMLQGSDESSEEKSKGQFIVTILFSSIAFVIAIIASHYAIKKHLRTQNKRIVDKTRMLEYPGISQKCTGASASKSEETDDLPLNGKTPMALQLDVDDEKVEMEDIGLTPMAGLTSMLHSPFSGADERRPLSPNELEEGAGRTSLGEMSEASMGLKKWLTPRKGLYNWITGTPKHDPPESDASSFRPSYDPSARKVSTTTELGIQQPDRRDTIGGNSYTSRGSYNGERKRKQKKQYDDGKSPLTIPMSFFSGGGDNKSDASGTPLASLDGSTGSSFFMKMGKSVFTGRKSMQSEGGMSDFSKGQARQSFEPQQNIAPRYMYNFGTTNSSVDHNEFEVTRAEPTLNAANLAALQEQSKLVSVEDSFSSFQPSQLQKSTLPKPGVMNPGSQGVNKIPPPHQQQPSKVPSSFHQPVNVARKVHSQPQIKPTNVSKTPLQQREIAGGKRPIPSDTVDSNSKRSRSSLGLGSDDESEFSLNDFEGYEVTNSSHKRNQLIESNYSDKRPIQARYHSTSNQNLFKSKPQGAQQPMKQTMKPIRAPPADSKPFYPSPAQKPTYTQGGERKAKAITDLSGTYDVFAPSGPIGIVVDTSKHGPAVHSLKATSPMLRLINPGDLIVALDDEDTRTMTAASLTRLMAKKSRQNERKITLMTPDDL